MVDASNFQKLELFRDPNNNDTFVARDPSDGSTFAVPFDSIEANSLSVNGTSFDEKADLTGTNGVLRSTQVPDLSITSIDTVANQSERLALNAEEGDVAIQTDVNKTFLLTTNDPTVDSNWSEVQLDVTGAISGQTITPSQTGTSTNRTDVVADNIEAGTIGSSSDRPDAFLDEANVNQLSGVSTGGDRQGCRVFLSSNQSISAGSTAKIQFDSEVYDSDNNFDTSTHNWTCPQDGLYLVNVQVEFAGGSSGDKRQVEIGTATGSNPSNVGAGSVHGDTDTGDILSATTINRRTKNDTIAGYALNKFNSDSFGSGNDIFASFMEVAFLGGL